MINSELYIFLMRKLRRVKQGDIL